MVSTHKTLKFVLPGLALVGSAVVTAGLTGCEVREDRPAYHLEGDGYGYRDYDHRDYDREDHHFRDRGGDRIDRERQQEDWNRSHY